MYECCPLASQPHDRQRSVGYLTQISISNAENLCGGLGPVINNNLLLKNNGMGDGILKQNTKCTASNTCHLLQSKWTVNWRHVAHHSPHRRDLAVDRYEFNYHYSEPQCLPHHLPNCCFAESHDLRHNHPRRRLLSWTVLKVINFPVSFQSSIN